MYHQHYEEFKNNHKIEKVQSYQADFEAQMENYRKRIINSALYNGMFFLHFTKDIFSYFRNYY